MTKIGYLRVSTREQCVDRRIDALKDLCDELHVERLSAVGRNRPVYQAVMDRLGPSDTLVVLDLDRAFRSTVDALTAMDRLRARGAALHIVNLQLDTSQPWGLLIYTVVAACAAFERQMLSQRTKEGLAAARERGKKLGRRPKLSPSQLAQARQRLAQPGERVARVAVELGVAPWTLSRSLKREKP